MKEELGYLERIYEEKDAGGDPGEKLISWNEERVQSFLASYRRALEGTSPEKLEEAGTLSKSVLKSLKASGIFGLTIPKEYGGLGFTLKEYLRVVEEAAAEDMALVLVPLAHLSIGMKGILLFGSDEQKKRYLTPAASGEMVFAYCLTEPKHGSDAQAIETSAVLSEDGGHYILNGGKTYITNGNYAGGLTVFARIDDGGETDRPKLGAFIVETAWKGVSVGADMEKMGLKISSTTAIRFKDVKVPVENRLGEEGDGFKIAMTILNYGRLGLGAASAGIMLKSYADMRSRGASRTQFGRPIGEFELIREKIGAAYAHGLAAAAITYRTATMLERDPLMNVAMESSHCKLYGTNAAWDSLYDAVQTYGGSGYLKTQKYEKRMRDFRVTTIFEGTTEIHSIYPPLSAARGIARRLKGKSGVAKFMTLLGLRHAAVAPPTTPAFPGTRALEVRLVRGAKRLITMGMMRYGKSLPEHQFLLRRATRLSLAFYILVSTRLYLQELIDDGGHASETERLKAAFALLTDEARRTLDRERRFKDDRGEEALNTIAG